MKIKDLPWFNRPGFKLTRKGVDGLDDAELLAIIFGVGIKGESALELSNRLFRDLNFDGLEKLSVKEIAKECKGDYNKARMIVSFFELIKRYNKFMKDGFDGKINEKNKFEKKQITCAKDVYNMFADRVRDYKKEYLFAVLLNTKTEIIGGSEIPISIGTLNASLVHPREVFKAAIRESANSIILVHNHPSGNCEPSEEDRKLTSSLFDAAELMGIYILDHIIIGRGDYYSFKDGKISEN